jgi:hypothetical protein
VSKEEEVLKRLLTSIEAVAAQNSQEEFSNAETDEI